MWKIQAQQLWFLRATPLSQTAWGLKKTQEADNKLKLDLLEQTEENSGEFLPGIESSNYKLKLLTCII